MIRLRVNELLEERGLTKYALYKVLNMSYTNYSKMINNETKSIRKEMIETLCVFFDCTPNDLFEYDFSMDESVEKASRKQEAEGANGAGGNAPS